MMRRSLLSGIGVSQVHERSLYEPSNKNGTILTAASEFTGDIYIEGETIRQIGTNLSVNASRTIDASGKYVMPGGVG